MPNRLNRWSVSGICAGGRLPNCAGGLLRNCAGGQANRSVPVRPTDRRPFGQPIRPQLRQPLASHTASPTAFPTTQQIRWTVTPTESVDSYANCERAWASTQRSHLASTLWSACTRLARAPPDNAWVFSGKYSLSRSGLAHYLPMMTGLIPTNIMVVWYTIMGRSSFFLFRRKKSCSFFLFFWKSKI